MDTGGEKFRRRRLKNGLAEYNLRVIVSGSGSIDPGAEIFRKHVFARHRFDDGADFKSKLEKAPGAWRDEVKICGKTEINFRAALRWLRAKWNVKRLLCEGGGELNDALFRAGLVDEIHLTICPKIFGGRSAPTIAEGIGFQRLAQAQWFKNQSIKLFEKELFTVFSKRK